MLQLTDGLLVERCRGGDREAFAEVVRRYQTLVCSVTYAATGNLMSSEELAQETFVTAWRSMKDLREEDKLKSWLCGIARNLANSHSRSRKRDVLNSASTIQWVDVASDSAEDPAKLSENREESELIDRTLASLPKSYREPLVLFYREQHSVARVAELLELTTETVKQRLSRGRKLLREEVEAVIERGLLQSAPGRAFTVGVISALPVMTGSAKAATLAVTSAKGIGSMNAAGLGGLIGVVLGPLAGLLGAYFGYSISMKAARSDNERAFVRKMTRVVFSLVVVMLILITGLAFYGNRFAQWNTTSLAIGIITLAMIYLSALVGLVFWGNKTIARIREQDGTTHVNATSLPNDSSATNPVRSYVSPIRLLGLPLVNIQFRGSIGLGDNRGSAAVGWIAIGEKAYGILFANGAFAVGGIAVGAVAIGPVAFGGLGIGAFAMAGFAIAYWALGGFSLGWFAFGGLAVAAHSAAGGLAVAKHFALGGVAMAEQINNEAAAEFFNSQVFFNVAQWLVQPWGVVLMLALTLLPSLIARKRIKSLQSAS